MDRRNSGRTLRLAARAAYADAAVALLTNAQEIPKEMKYIVLASIVAGVLAAPAAAQNANGNANTGANAAAGFTAKNVDPVHPFGSINTYNVGVEPAQVSAWAKTLSPGQKQEMAGRCSVILQNQQNYYSETANFCRSFPSR
jgi:hypothetical protein